MRISEKEYIEYISPFVQKYAIKRGYDYAGAIIAQACVESGYGNSMLAQKYHNHFGMKCGSKWMGKSVNLRTMEEYTQGKITAIRDNFRAYDNDEIGVAGYFDFISTTRYAALKKAKSALDYLEIIRNCGYATSYSYVKTVYRAYSLYGLSKYDNKKQINVDMYNVVADVIDGKYGTGEIRKKALENAGYDYKEIQKLVNAKLKEKIKR